MELYKFKIKEIRPNLFHLIFPNQYSLVSTLFRIQEFYESPDKKIRGHWFSTEQLMDSYAKQFGNFSYFLDFEGFNFPGKILCDFFQTFTDFSSKEENLFSQLNAHKKIGKWWPENRYVDKIKHKNYFIATSTEKHDITASTVLHETAHGMYYLNPSYKSMVNNTIKSVNSLVRSGIFKQLRKVGYCENVFVDEMNAYLSTSTKQQFLNDLEYKENILNFDWKKIHGQFKALFEATK